MRHPFHNFLKQYFANASPQKFFPSLHSRFSLILSHDQAISKPFTTKISGFYNARKNGSKNIVGIEENAGFLLFSQQFFQNSFCPD